MTRKEKYNSLDLSYADLFKKLVSLVSQST